MHLLGTFAGIALTGTAGVLIGSTTAFAQNELGTSTLPPTVGLRTNVVNLTATNFVAGSAMVTNGIFVSSEPNNVPPTSILGTNISVRPITLQDAVSLALQHNYAVQIARFDPDIAGFNLSGSYSVYEPSFQFSYTHAYSVSPGGLTQDGLPLPSRSVYFDQFNADPGITGYLPSGTRYTLGANVNSQDPEGPDQFTSRAGISLTQPLLRDFWIDQPRSTIMINKKRLQISEWQLREQLINTIAQVEDAYYSLIQSRENIKAQRAALAYANQLLRENKKRVEVGALAPLDEKQAEAEVASAVANLLVTEQVYAVALNNMKNLITSDFASWTNVVLDPAETLVAVPATPDLPESWKRGLTMRPDVQQLRLDLEAQDINLKFLKNQLWPALDVVGSYGHSGLNTSYTRAVEDLSRDDFRNHSVGARLTIPLGNRRARYNLKAARATKEQAILQYKALEQSVMVSIDNAIKLLQSRFQQVEAARQARLFAQDALAAEQKKYENGKSTSFLVLQAQRDLTSRRFQEIGALADYNKALSGLAAAEGATLDRLNLNVNVQ